MADDLGDHVLSERERRVLAGMEVQLELSDPGLARRLRGASRRGRSVVLFAIAMIVVGAAFMLATFTTSLPAALSGAALMAVGEGLLARTVSVADRVRERFRPMDVEPLTDSGGD